MLNRLLSIVLICLLSVLTCFAQTQSPSPRDPGKQIAKLTRAELLKPQPSKVDHQKDAYKQKKEKDDSKKEKVLLWAGIAVTAAVVAGLIIWQGGFIKTGSRTVIKIPGPGPH